jgi:uncharacterized protein (TIGR00661 family)
MKILFVASHCAGLGHLNRMVCIAKEIKKINPKHQILFLTASGKDTFLKNQFRYVEIPLSERTLTENGYSPDLDVHLSSQAIRGYKPDVIVFDTHFPLALLKITKLRGIKTVVILRKAKKDCFNKIIKLRGIDLFIFPHEEKEFKDYSIPKKTKAVFVGPIIRKFDKSLIREVIKRYKIKKDDFVVVFTCGSGGGKESRDFIYTATKVYKQLHEKIRNLKFIVLTGLYFQEKITAEGIIIKKFEPELINLMRASDLVVAIAGYNTCNEIILSKAPSILIPAKRINEEQGERASEMERVGISIALKDIDDKKITDNILKYYKSEKMRKKMKESFSKVKMRIGNRKAAQEILSIY